MDLSELERLEAPAKVLKLSEAIRIGARQTLPSRENGKTVWIQEVDNQCFACVIGAAWIGMGGSLDIHKRLGQVNTRWVSQNFGLPTELAQKLHHMYEHQSLSREQCADWLQAQGY